jgi:transcriptional regulator with XRE-family HTH domain
MATTVFKKPNKKQITQAKNNFAEVLRKRRQSLKMSQSSLANLAGVDRKTINRIENGHFSPNLDTIVRLMTVLNLTPAKLIKFNV